MITQEKIIEAKSKAENLVNKSMNQIAEDNNIQIKIQDLSDIGGKALSGAITKDAKEEKYYIYINKNDSLKRQKFTLAHELGHYFMHKSFLDEKTIIVDNNNSKYLYHLEEFEGLDEESRKREYEANEFAGNLLMPEKKFKELVKVFPINKLSDIFEVSEKAVSVRAYNLTDRQYD